MRYPQAYHITWPTHGSRLPGTSKPHVDRDHNAYLGPLAPTNLERENRALELMKSDPISLTMSQRKVVEMAIYEIAARFAWTIHALAAKSDHVHVVITAVREAEALRNAIKAAATRELNRNFGKRRWWAENGSVRYLWERSYFFNAVEYVNRQRDF